MRTLKSTAKTVVSEDKVSRIHALASGVLTAYAITCIIMIGYAMLITYSTFTGERLPFVVTVTALVSVIVAGFDAAKGADSRGWMWGIIAGALYAVILVAIGIWVMHGLQIDSRTITMVILSIAGGGLGGVIGINFKKR